MAKDIVRDSKAGRFIKTPAKAGSVKAALVDRAIKKIAESRHPPLIKSNSAKSASAKA